MTVNNDGLDRKRHHKDVLVFSPKGWDSSAQGNALGLRPSIISSLKGWEMLVAALQAAERFRSQPRALPWAEESQPFGLNTAGSAYLTVSNDGQDWECQ